jgi:hypothetical protein
MILDRKVACGLLAVSVLSVFLTAHGLHVGLHHFRAFEGGGNAD